MMKRDRPDRAGKSAAGGASGFFSRAAQASLVAQNAFHQFPEASE